MCDAKKRTHFCENELWKWPSQYEINFFSLQDSDLTIDLSRLSGDYILWVFRSLLGKIACLWRVVFSAWWWVYSQDYLGLWCVVYICFTTCDSIMLISKPKRRVRGRGGLWFSDKITAWEIDWKTRIPVTLVAFLTSNHSLLQDMPCLSPASFRILLPPSSDALMHT